MAMLMIGGSDFLEGFMNFKSQPVFIFLGLCVMGFGLSFTSIPVLPEMLESIEEDEELSREYDRELVENTTSGLFISFQSIGEAIGPVISAHLAEAFGFQEAQEIYSAYLVIFIVAYFCCCGMFSACGLVDKKKTGIRRDEEGTELIN